MSARASDPAQRSRGFTLIEMIAIILILGILAVVAVPRMTTSEYRSFEFRDRVASALRYAQKTAVSHRRMVCAEFTTTTATLTIDHDKTGACNNQALNLPAANSNVVQSTDATTASFGTVAPSTIYFQSDGRATSDAGGTTLTSPTLSISGQTITVTGATGHVL